MSCSICGKDGHNARSCPTKAASEPRDQALIVKYDMITKTEASKLQAKAIKIKDEIAPRGRGTSVKGRATDLPLMLRSSAKPKKLRNRNG